MDIELLIYWQQDRPNLIEGAIVECRQVRFATWDSPKKEYVPDQGAVYTPNCVIIYVTGVPITSVDDVKHLLEERQDESTGAIRLWSAKRNALHPTQEGTPLMTRGYLTITWGRLKEIIAGIDELVLNDSMLGDAYWEAKV